ncbi:MAG: EscU/YscU/HrcU family type III secretion system export apparatus switch protein [Verrucomicrobia bacterium]|nr:EscU/YscU/HrcU family type III secretion system export apparatus switch protein [Verrucomicrobiota bacterium]
MSDSSDRTERATPKHRNEARQKGQVARSMEISSAVIIITGLVCLTWLGPALGHGLIDFMRQTFSLLPHAEADVPYQGGFFASSASRVFAATTLWMGALVVASLIAGFGQAGFVLATGTLSPKWSSLNPINGFKRIFSWMSAVRAIAAVLKLAVIVLVCRGTVERVLQSDLFHRSASSIELVAHLLETTLALGWKVALAMIVISAGDYAYQYWSHEKSLKMSKEDVKEEGKQSEPNPMVKGKIRSKMRDMVRKSMKKVKPMFKEVPRATVVITNPTHVAVALTYDRATMSAPRVVAKGLRLMAERIKGCARTHGVPILENKPLARGLYRHCPLGAEIPASYFQAVATVMAQVYRLSAKKGVPPVPGAPNTPPATHNGP